MYILERQIDTEREDFNEKLQHIFFDYLPNHKHNYSHTIGPIDRKIIDNDQLIGDFDVGLFLGNGDFASVFRWHPSTH